MKKTCLICGKQFEYEHNIPPGNLEKNAETDKRLYKYLVCSDECLSRITNGEITKKREAISDMEIKLYELLDSFISINPEFTYIIIDKLKYDEQKSKDQKTPAYLAEWKILRSNTQGEMTINEPNDNIENSYDFDGAWYSDDELGLSKGIKLDSIIVRWNNLQYFKAQKDKDKCSSELLEFGESKIWMKRKKYFDNALTEFREWYKKNNKIPPELKSFVEAANYSETPRSPKVIRLLALAKEYKLEKGETIPGLIRFQIASKLTDEGFGETDIEYVRRTLGKYDYGKPKTYDRK